MPRAHRLIPLCLAAAPLHGAITGPYTPDADTVHLFHLDQSSQGKGYVPPANTADRISVLEWDAARYFAHHPQPSFSFNPAGTQITLVCPSEPSGSYRLWSSVNVQDWTAVETRGGSGEDLVFTQPAATGETKRFWRIESVEGGF